MAQTIKIAIALDEKGKLFIDAPMGNEQQKTLTMNVLLGAMNIVNNYEVKKLVVAQKAPN